MRCKQFIIVSLAGVVLAASLAGCGGAAPASSAAASSEAASSVVVSSAAAETALPDGVYRPLISRPTAVCSTPMKPATAKAP